MSRFFSYAARTGAYLVTFLLAAVWIVDALDTLLRVHPRRRAFAVPLRMESGTQYRQRLPPGEWMLTVLPREERGPNPIRIFMDGAVCDSNLLNDPGRLGCSAGSRASVIVYW